MKNKRKRLRKHRTRENIKITNQLFSFGLSNIYVDFLLTSNQEYFYKCRINNEFNSQILIKKILRRIIIKLLNQSCFQLDIKYIIHL